MNFREQIFPVFAALALLAGCGTVRDARDAQAKYAAVGAGGRPASQAVAVDLRGAPLRALVEFALTNRPSMVSAAIAVRDSRLALKQIAADAPVASSTPWNAAGVSGSLAYSEASPSAKLKDLDHTRKGKATGGLSLDLLLYDFGRNAAQAKAQAEKVIAAELALAQEGCTVFDEVAENYFDLLRNEALLEVACTNEYEYAEHLRQAEELFAQGEANEVDVLRARLDLARARQDVVSASNDVVTAGADLMAAMGVDAATGDAEAVVGRGSGGLARMLKALPESTQDAKAAFDFAATNAPAMKIARARLRAASADVDYAVANLLPSVSASVSLRWTDPLWYWNWGLDAAQTLFTGFRKTTAVDRAVLAMETAASEVDGESQRLSYDVTLAVAERDNAREALSTARTSLREARENLETVKARYELGETSWVDFTSAVASMTEACGDRIKAYYRGQAAEAKLLRLAGVEPEYPVEEWIDGEE